MITVRRLLSINFLIRIGAAGTGQLFAFLLAERMASRVGAGAIWVGLVGAAFFATELIGAPFAGRAADRVGQVRVLLWGPLFGVVSAAVAALAVFGASHVGILIGVVLIARLAEGASAACAVPTTLTLLSRATDANPRRRNRVMGAFEVTSLAGMCTGYIVAGITWDLLGVMAFLALPPLYTVAAGLVWSAPGGSDSARVGPTAPGIWSVLGSMAREAGALPFGVAWLAVNAVVGLWIQQAPFLLSLPERSPEQALVGGYSGQQVGAVFAVWVLALMAGIALWSLFGTSVRRSRAMSVAMIGMLGVVASLGWLNHGGPNVLVWIAVGFVLVEAGFAPAAFAHLAQITVPLDVSRATALGLYSVLLGGGQLIGNLLGGPFSARWQMDGVLGLTALLAVVALAGLSRMSRTDPGS